MEMDEDHLEFKVRNDIDLRQINHNMKLIKNTIGSVFSVRVEDVYTMIYSICRYV